ncbi:hypothetical protein BD309DRAFT_997433 [Dichomitus squalens]|uniref:Uncharacterized protein n=1 Tax=Dichomitus squalens TaxID=114155 RepID=A0A4Q9PTR5_9APHY|nr:hypothetical protein BD309DRAFT_997433 [Dichomitus squalens]TBU57871.1 hypothetical protein BD310DRAFT_1039611 [Dichomitus squalens]
MFLFRAVFIITTVFMAFVAQVSAIPPLTRFMLDAVPDGSESAADSNSNAVVAPGDHGADTSASVDQDVPIAVESSPVQEDTAVESSAVALAAQPSAADIAASSAVSVPSAVVGAQLAQANAAGHLGVLGSTSVLVGSVVAGIVLAI